ncbi:ABC transporter ATP-binding protein [Gephyromycinifex aptenodytis]|uniref:ABC transporter ATP-binding protein n=1 Tax=Gephyromycinifex aptenodytis TaxID=2716227 RepID=UPI001444FDE4|nr:ABC transporter ATP-binding protein [Gephyromycinifex aptenodytis]
MRSLSQILTATRQLWPYYLGILVCSVLVALAGLVTPFLIKLATDVVVAETSGSGVDDVTRTVLWIASGLLVAEVAGGLIQNFGGYLGDVMAARMREILSTRYYAKLLELPTRYYDEQVTGTIISRLTRSITEVTTFLNSFSNNFFPMLLTVVAVLAVSAVYYWPLAVLLAIIFPAYFWLTALTSTRWQRLEIEKNEQIDLAGGRFAEVVGQIRVVKSFVQEARELGVFSRRFRATVDTTRHQSRYWHFMDAARRAVLGAIFFAIYAILFVRAANGQMSIGDMVLLIQLVAMARQPVTMMSYLVDTAQRAMAGSREYFAVMNEASDRDEHLPVPAEQSAVTPSAALVRPLPPSASAAAALPQMLQFEHVSFAYEDGNEVLHDVSFSVAHGSRVALVSESGGGKTTLVNLLLGFYRATSGRILLAGYDVQDLPRSLLRAHVGVVFQDASLFSGTIGENIAYARPQASEEEVVAAAKRAYAHPFVRQFRAGYDSTIGERGLKLSGGQKQRIAVARAILKDAPILVLDEATSALDTKSERLVQRGLDELMVGRTSLIIAHRLSTISTVDQIVTLREGRVDEIGSPQELANSGGIYSELLGLQASASRQDRKRLKEYGFTA